LWQVYDYKHAFEEYPFIFRQLNISHANNYGNSTLQEKQANQLIKKNHRISVVSVRY